MPVSIKGSGGGGVTLDAGAAATNTTLTLPNTTGTVVIANASNNVAVTGDLNVSGATTLAGNPTVAGTVAMGSSFLRNRIINGAMVIDQRNAGASVTINTTTPFVLDRWTGYSDLANMTGQRTQATVPVGLTYALGVTVGTGAAPSASQISRLEQRIEGYNFADLYWGGANALPITLSFWVRSSVTGTHSGSLVNSAATRSYPFTFTISVGNTWEYKTVSVTGDLTGTWLTDNSTGCKVIFNLGTGTTYLGTAGAWAAANYFGATGSVQLAATTGATFYITGVQLEVGTVATPFERRLYGTELALCQRYFETSFPIGTAPANATATYSYYSSAQSSSVSIYVGVGLKVSKRSTPTVTIYSSNAIGSPSANQIQYFNNAGAGWTNSSNTAAAALNDNSFYINSTTSGTAGYSYLTAFGWTASAEL